MLIEQSDDTFHSKDNGQDNKQNTHDDLHIGAPVSAAGSDLSQLGFGVNTQGEDGYGQHEEHGDNAHELGLSCVAQPGSYSQ